ncbi:MAG: anti-sigma factor antagonist, partial [Clostridia bacterium]|nr:anti-sigma factor antagonist [Clostridia bacterium]
IVRGSPLCITLSGELDECSSLRVRQRCDGLIDDNPLAESIVINLAGVKFMDSTGIGFLIGRYKKAARLGIPVFIENPDFAADKILNLSGIYSLIPKAQ